MDGDFKQFYQEWRRFSRSYIERMEQIEFLLLGILKEQGQIMAIDRKTFDTDLAALVAAIGTLVTAVDALIASSPPADLTAEDTNVQAAAKQVADSLNKLNPPTPVPTPAPIPTP